MSKMTRRSAFRDRLRENALKQGIVLGSSKKELSRLEKALRRLLARDGRR